MNFCTKSKESGSDCEYSEQRDQFTREHWDLGQQKKPEILPEKIISRLGKHKQDGALRDT